MSVSSVKKKGGGYQEHGLQVVVRSKGHEMLRVLTLAVLLLLRSRSSCFCLGDGLPDIVSSFFFEVFTPEENFFKTGHSFCRCFNLRAIPS